MQESETIEYKKSLAELSEGLNSVAAILNKHGSGELWFGIRNDGRPVGLDVSETTLRKVSQAIAAHIEPKIYPEVSKVVLEDKSCIRVSFSGGQKPYYAHGRAYMRVADEDRQLSAKEIESIILKNIRIGMRLDGLVRIDVPEIDREAFREAIINAFCHRDYRDPDEVRIAIFPDRIEVRNPGTLMEGVTLRTLKTAKVSRRRNPLIADLLRRIQLIEAWGRGIPLILEKAPNVRFTQVAGIFITEFPRAVSESDTSITPPVEAPVEAPGTPPVTPQVTPPVAVLVLLRLIQSMGPLGNSEILVHLGLKDRTHLRNHYIDPALTAGLIERTLPDKPNSRFQRYRLTAKGRSMKPYPS